MDSTSSQIGNASQVVNSPGAIVKHTQINEAASPPNLIQRMFGPAADEVGEFLKDQVRIYRRGRLTECVNKAETMLIEAGISPQAVPPKILFPLLDGASLEEDESLHDMWAGLLANGASPENAGKVRPGFVATLKQMAPDEAGLLNLMFERRTGKPGVVFNQPFDVTELLSAYSSVRPPGDSDQLAYDACIQSLHAQQLVEQIPDPKHFGYLIHSYALTMRGIAFVFACRPPKPKP